MNLRVELPVDRPVDGRAAIYAGIAALASVLYVGKRNVDDPGPHSIPLVALGTGAIAAPATIMNAVMNALTPLGVRHLDMPATPSRIWHAIQAAKRAADYGLPPPSPPEILN